MSDVVEPEVFSEDVDRFLQTIVSHCEGKNVDVVVNVLANALINHGNATAIGREQAEKVRRHEEWIRDLQNRQAADDEAHGRRSRP